MSEIVSDFFIYFLFYAQYLFFMLEDLSSVYDMLSQNYCTGHNFILKVM